MEQLVALVWMDYTLRLNLEFEQWNIGQEMKGLIKGIRMRGRH